MSLVAIVPARSGSKRLPNKNMMPLGGKPLSIWTLEAVTASPSVDEVIFSTDSPDYWDQVQGIIDSEKLRLDLRSPEAAGDNVKIFDYLVDNGTRLFDGHEAFLLALPTCPFRQSVHVEGAIEMFHASGSSVFSASEYEFATTFAFEVIDGKWKTIRDDNPMCTGSTRSQDQKRTYHPNGAIYVMETSRLMDPSLTSLYDGALPYLMDRRYSQDIDDAYDFSLAEAMLKIANTESQ